MVTRVRVEGYAFPTNIAGNKQNKCIRGVPFIITAAIFMPSSSTFPRCLILIWLLNVHVQI
ncbi:MAG: hypothetical protein M0Z75_15875, partial [Nitrospiraceae bacterium]|nr:hypothetical protein [Nitrospiraceae bacterium]